MDPISLILIIIAAWCILGFVMPIVATICCWLEQDRQVFSKLMDIIIAPVNLGCDVSMKILNRFLEKRDC